MMMTPNGRKTNSKTNLTPLEICLKPNLRRVGGALRDVPIMIAVPVSWQPGSTIPAAMLAFLRNSSATYLSFFDASGSFRIFESCCNGTQ